MLNSPTINFPDSIILRLSVLLLFLLSSAVQAQTPRSPEDYLKRGVAWLHSFEYEEAERAFTQVTLTDQKCGMGYWGVAMSNYHPIWAPPTMEEVKIR
jgi:hypothetical protein